MVGQEGSGEELAKTAFMAAETVFPYPE